MKLFRWLCVLPAAILGFVLSFLVAIPLNRLIHDLLWTNGHMMPGKDFILYVLPYDGAVAASLFIIAGVLVAPERKGLTALILLLLGGIVAWLQVGEFYAPDANPHGPIRVWWPIVGTYLGGLVAYASVIVTCSSYRTKDDNTRDLR
jgi:RsiW-degrading membrane proteinase PrsW (M82 family)